MSRWTRAKNVWLRIKQWWKWNWILIHPGPEVRRGAVWGVLAAATACVVIAGLCLKTGFGYAFDFAFAILFAALSIPLTMLAVMLLLTIARNLPRLATGIIVGSSAVVMMLWGPPALGIPIAIVVGVTEGALGATIATFVAGESECQWTVPRAATFLWSGQRHPAAGIPGERCAKNENGGCVGFLQGFQRMAALGAQEVLGI